MHAWGARATCAVPTSRCRCVHFLMRKCRQGDFTLKRADVSDPKVFLKSIDIITQMSRNSYAGPKLPKSLLSQVQIGGISTRKQGFSRKDRRKAERLAKKSVSSKLRLNARRDHASKVIPFGEEEDDLDEDYSLLSPAAPSRTPAKNAKPLKSTLKKQPPAPPQGLESEGGQEEWDEISPLVVFLARSKAALRRMMLR